MANYFLEKYGEPNTDPAKVGEIDRVSGNYFLEKYGEPNVVPETAPTGPNIADEDPTWADYGRLVMSGGAQIGAGIGWLFDSADWGQSLKESGTDAAAWWLEDLSPQAKAALQTEFTKRDRGELWTDAKWNRAKLTAMQSLLGTMSGMGIGAILTKTLGAAGMTTAVTTAAGATVQAPSKVAGMLGYGLGEASVAAPSVGAGVEAQIMAMDTDKLYAEAADYRAIYDALENVDPEVRAERAKKMLAKAAAGDASQLALVSTFLLSAPFGSLMAKMTAGLPLARSGGRLAGAAKGAAGEAGQEFLQSGAERIAENIGIRQADPSRGLMEGALEEAVGGMMAGGLMGAGPGFAANPELASPPEGPPLEDTESPLAAVAGSTIPETDIDPVTGDPVIREEKDALDETLLDSYFELEKSTREADSREAKILEQLVEVRDVAVADAERGAAFVELEGARDVQIQKQKDVAEAALREKEQRQVGKDVKTEVTGQREILEQRKQEELEREIRVAEAEGAGVPPGGGGAGVGVSVGAALQDAMQQRQQEPASEPITKGVPALSVPDPEVEYADKRLLDPIKRGQLESIVGDLHKGGGSTLAPDQDYKPGESDKRNDDGSYEVPLKRTPSLNPDWFQTMMANREVPSVAWAKNAVEKSLAGKRLSDKQKRFVGNLFDIIEGEEADANFEGRAATSKKQRDKISAEVKAAGRTESFELTQEQDGVVPEKPKAPEPKTPRKQVEADTGVPGDLFSTEANKQIDLVDESRAAARKEAGLPEGLVLREQSTQKNDDEIVGEFLVGFYGKDHAIKNLATYAAGDTGASQLDKKATQLASRGKQVIIDAYNDAQSGAQPAEKYLEEFRNAIKYRKEKGKFKEGMLGSRHDYLEARWFFEKGKKREVSWENVSAVTKALKLDLNPTGDLLAATATPSAIEFVIDEKKFNETGPDTNERVFEATVPKNRKGIDIRLKNEGNNFISMEEADKIVTGWEDHAKAQSSQKGGPQDHTDNFNRVILSLFDVTGTWANPYALAGYDVRAIDIKGGVDITDFSSEYLEELFDSFGGKEVYGIMAACPCTTYSNSGTRWRKTRHDAKDRDVIREMWGDKAAEAKNEDGSWMYETPNDYANELVAQTMRTLEYYRPQFWALENPEGRIQTSAGLPDKWRTAFQPHNFGEPYTKRTLLWGNFDADMPTANVEPSEGSKMHLLPPSEGRAAVRAETPVGFSYAFFMANNFMDKSPLERTKADYWYMSGAIEEAFRAGVTEDQIRDNLEIEGDYEGPDNVEVDKDVLRELIAKAPGTPAPTEPPPAASAPAPVESEADQEAREEREAIQGEPADDESNEIGDIPGWEDIHVDAATSPQNDLPPPTKGQKEAGNYPAAHITIKKMPITIENPKGSSRNGFKQTEHYGYIRLTEGKDGDHLDVFVNPNIQTDYKNEVYVIDQMEQKTGQFDEHKVMLGYTNQLAAVRAYKRNYEKGWKVGPVTAMDMATFKKWTQSRAKLTKPASEDAFFGEQSRLSGRASKGMPRQSQPTERTRDPKTGKITQIRVPGKVGREFRFSAKKQGQMDLFEAGKGAVNAPNQKYVNAILGAKVSAVRMGQPTGASITEATKGMNELVSNYVATQESRAEQKEQAKVEPKTYSKKEIEQDTEVLREAMPGASINVLDSLQDAPARVRTGLKQKKLGHAAAVTDLNTGIIYIFSDKIYDAEDANKVVLHEATHKGLRVAFGEELDPMLEDLYSNAPAKYEKALASIVETYRLDIANSEDRMEAAEELLAHIAENDPKHSVVKDFIGKIRQLLRQMGIKIGRWSNEEIVAVIKEAQGSLARSKDRIAGITLDEEYLVAETDEIYTVANDVREMLTQIEKREGVLEKVQNCL